MYNEHARSLRLLHGTICWHLCIFGNCGGTRCCTKCTIFSIVTPVVFVEFYEWFWYWFLYCLVILLWRTLWLQNMDGPDKPSTCPPWLYISARRKAPPLSLMRVWYHWYPLLFINFWTVVALSSLTIHVTKVTVELCLKCCDCSALRCEITRCASHHIDGFVSMLCLQLSRVLSPYGLVDIRMQDIRHAIVAVRAHKMWVTSLSLLEM